MKVIITKMSFSLEGNGRCIAVKCKKEIIIAENKFAELI